MKYLSKILFIVLSCCLFISGCTRSYKQRVQRADNIAGIHGFTSKIVKGGDFWLATYQKITNASMPYVVYIEGDGTIMQNKYTISDNPTPQSDMMLRLATLDPRPNVIYIARPCQFTPVELNELCRNNAYWTDKRLSREVVDAVTDAVLAISAGSSVDLVGFSGGGGIATLVASELRIKPYVRSIITVAGLLDHISFNQKHKSRPMVGSLNPIDYAPIISDIPQLHLSGGKDRIVPAFIADKYVAASKSPCVKHEIVTEASHIDRTWVEVWPSILEKLPLRCY